MTFSLRYRDGAFAGQSTIESYMTGGGFDKEGQFRGQDWALLRLLRPLGSPDQWMALYSGEAMTGMPITIAGYSQGYKQAKEAIYDVCTVEDPPKNLESKCAKLPSGEYSCNFFAHHCDVGSSVSGGPILTEIEGQYFIVGIHTGGSKIGEETFKWGMTVNAASPASSDIHFHWYNQLNFTKIDEISKRLTQFSSWEMKPNRDDITPQRFEWLVRYWSQLPLNRRWQEIQLWNTHSGQQTLFWLSQIFEYYISESAGSGALKIPLDLSQVGLNGLRDGEYAYSPYYSLKGENLFVPPMDETEKPLPVAGRAALPDFSKMSVPNAIHWLERDMAVRKSEYGKLAQELSALLSGGKTDPKTQHRIREIKSNMLMFRDYIADCQKAIADLRARL